MKSSLRIVVWLAAHWGWRAYRYGDAPLARREPLGWLTGSAGLTSGHSSLGAALVPLFGLELVLAPPSSLLSLFLLLSFLPVLALPFTFSLPFITRLFPFDFDAKEWLVPEAEKEAEGIIDEAGTAGSISTSFSFISRRSSASASDIGCGTVSVTNVDSWAQNDNCEKSRTFQKHELLILLCRRSCRLV
jgi:hypothetical protein